MIVGGFTEHQEITDDVAELVTGLKSDVEGALSAAFEIFEPRTFASQVVAGTNYMVRVHIGDEKHVMVKLHKPLPHREQTPHLMSASFEGEAETEEE